MRPADGLNRAQIRASRSSAARRNARSGRLSRRRPICWIRSEQVVFQNAAKGGDSVAPADLLAFKIGTAVIGDAHLVHATSHLRNLCRDLRFKTESFLFYLKLLQHIAAKDLVTSLHVSEVQVSKAIGDEREQPVAKVMPKEKHAVGVAADETRAVDHVRPSFSDGLDQFGIVIRIVLKICALDDDDVTLGHRNSGMQRSAL